MLFHENIWGQSLYFSYCNNILLNSTNMGELIIRLKKLAII